VWRTQAHAGNADGANELCCGGDVAGLKIAQVEVLLSLGKCCSEKLDAFFT